MSKDILIDGERAFPIYEFSAEWVERGQHSPGKTNRWQQGLPEGRIRNATSHYRAYRETPLPRQLHKDIADWWERCANRYHEKQPTAPILTIQFVHNETWWIEWFQHATFDVGQDDAAALASFRRFVRRMEDWNRREGRCVDGHFVEPYCLMGAEDRDRWCGTADGSPESQTTPPCRCEHCKVHGLIRIGH